MQGLQRRIGICGEHLETLLKEAVAPFATSIHSCNTTNLPVPT
jgi:hypothetical protein